MRSLSLFTFALFASLAVSVVANAAEGTFTGASDHEVRGAVEIVANGDGHTIELGEDFFLDGAPDPKVAVGSGEKPAHILDPLENNTGAQTYTLPADIDPASIERVWIWCQQFDVPLGIADVN